MIKKKKEKEGTWKKKKKKKKRDENLMWKTKKIMIGIGTTNLL